MQLIIIIAYLQGLLVSTYVAVVLMLVTSSGMQTIAGSFSLSNTLVGSLQISSTSTN